ncbi:MAG TPA: RnfABCDGE type electron transport complex subunit D [Marinospirillum sp.]|uniref:RnfABCDGE type electron transport complex subunit D n=1 Tax=Marinospirillum sp. TaxID=2183934 RepID=UPI002B475A3F|nr:RnfABCDGE type electron transport complex subunit D [Marinospirillum sp.]HKM14424.1 RnfABCDGE type electron transport complex subunit D [Marinospirillum sp.]
MTSMQFNASHAHGNSSTRWVMQQVMLACIPGVLTLSYFFGLGVLFNILLACSTALVAEALVLKLRKRSFAALHDYSALLTGLLLAVCLPASAPWWIPVSGALFALLIGKHLFGGLGQNPFNPAMTAYAFLLISFPLPMTLWPMPFNADDLSWFNSLQGADTITGATALDAWRNKGTLMAQEFWQSTRVINPATLNPAVLQTASHLALAWLLGGSYLVVKRLINWQLPLAFFATMLVFSTFLWGIDTSHYAAPWLHFAAGSAVFAAFFILTDPASGATSIKGRIYFAIGAGLLVISIRTWGSYPDGIAFAVLLMNFAAPALDYVTRPRVYGHKK